MQTAHAHIYEFGTFQLDTAKRVLRRLDGTPVSLSPRVFDTLLYMVEHHAAVLDKERIMEAVWPDSSVEENNLAQAISKLRQIFGETPASHDYIVTVPGRGYRFVAEVTEQTTDSALTPNAKSLTTETWAHKSTASIPEKSIAVLPFENLSRDPENAFFTDGVQDEILTYLSKIADLKVISRTSVMLYKCGNLRNLREIGEQLGVAHLLEGSVQRSGNRVRVMAHLIDARTDTHVWAQTYDRDLADVFAIQSEIAKTIADQLQARLSPAEKAAIDERPTADLVAYDLYVSAKALRASISWNLDARMKEKLLRAASLLDQAVARDPAFFLAYCQVADVHECLYFSGAYHTQTRLALANAAVKTAVRLRPDSGEAHLALAAHAYHGHLDYDRARQELAIARRALPNDPSILELTAYIDRRQGRWDDSLANFKRALQLDPRNLFIFHELSATYQLLRRYTDMAAILDRALALAPGDPITRVARAWVDLESKADPKPMHAAIQAIIAEDPGTTSGLAEQWLLVALCQRDPVAIDRALAAIPRDGISKENIWFPRGWYEGVAARTRGSAAAARTAFTAAREEIEKMLREQPDYAQALSVLGMIDAGLGRKAEAIDRGRRAVELLPVAKDAFAGGHMTRYLAIIYSWTGENNLAIEQLAAVIRRPGYLSYGRLKLHPEWDPLRGDARFEKLVASLAPKSKS
jgi:TolB-like protein/Tfp pilus assembly protein PilF